jgi:hypothetical protein
MKGVIGASLNVSCTIAVVRSTRFQHRARRAAKQMPGRLISARCSGRSSRKPALEHAAHKIAIQDRADVKRNTIFQSGIADR